LFSAKPAAKKTAPIVMRGDKITGMESF